MCRPCDLADSSPVRWDSLRGPTRWLRATSLPRYVSRFLIVPTSRGWIYFIYFLLLFFRRLRPALGAMVSSTSGTPVSARRIVEVRGRKVARSLTAENGLMFTPPRARRLTRTEKHHRSISSSILFRLDTRPFRTAARITRRS